ncbi:hypothetical protein ACMFMG_000123 [Clarireedia jacksonii]
MAIIDKLPGIKVTVTVNGEDLQEYPDEDGPQDVQYKKTTAPPGFSSSKFIECVSDEEFTIALEVGPPFKLDPRYEALLFEVDIDGISIACLAFEREAIQYYPRRAHISESIRRINKTQRAQEIDQIKQEGAQETCSSRKRPADEILNPSTGKAYKTSHAANGDLVVDLTDD